MEARRGWGVGKTEAAWRSDWARMQAVYRHLIASGIPGVDLTGSGFTRRLTIQGWNARVRKDLPRQFINKGRHRVIDDLQADDRRPLVIFDVPSYAEDPAEIMVCIPMEDFIRIIRKDHQ